MSIEYYEAMFGPITKPKIVPAPSPRATQITPIWLKHPKPGIYLVGEIVHGPFRSTQAALDQLTRHHREAAPSPITSVQPPHS